MPTARTGSASGASYIKSDVCAAPDDPSIGRKREPPRPRFGVHRSRHRHRLRTPRGTSRFLTLVPVFDLKFITEPAATAVGLQIGGARTTARGRGETVDARDL